MGRFQHDEVIAETGVILKERQVNVSLESDVKTQIGGLFRMNAGGAIGYLFTEGSTGKEIARGMFCHRLREIDLNQWSYIADLETGTIFKLFNATKAIMNELARRP